MAGTCVSERRNEFTARTRFDPTINELGKRYGKLVVMDRVTMADGGNATRWECRCDCGNTRVATGYQLRAGRVLACHRCTPVVGNRAPDITGQRFGRLVVVERTVNSERRGPNGSTQSRWVCRCDCGKQHVVLGCNLRRDKVRSCGCLLTVREAPKPTQGSEALARLLASRPDVGAEFGWRRDQLLAWASAKRYPQLATQAELDRYVPQELWYQPAEPS